MNKNVIQAITDIANSEPILKKLEPHNISHITIRTSETKRILYAFLLFQSELKSYYLRKK